MTSVKKRIEYILKHNLFIQRTYKIIFSTILKFIGIFIKTKDNLVLINSYGGRRYNDSPKTIFEALIKNKKLGHLEYIWAFEEPEKFDIPCKKVKIDTFIYFLSALKAKYWITNVNIERGLHFKKRKTIYLNTWHGIPLKLVGNAVSGRNDFDFSNVDIFCYSSTFEKDIYIRDFGVLENKLLLSGLPRNEELYYISKEKISGLREKIGIPEGKKVILYAPTWRESIDNGRSYLIKPPIDVNLWENELSEDYIIIFRMHHFTTKLLGLEFNNFLRDGSQYPELNDLLIISDILISDYSAIIYDYAILEKPIISFSYDFNTYMSERGFYLDLTKELPSGILTTQDEVIQKIKNLDYNEECMKTSKFKKKYLHAGDKATSMCIDLLFKN